MATEVTNFPRESTMREILNAIKAGNAAAAGNIQNFKISAPELVPTLIDKYGAKEAFPMFCKMALASDGGMTLNDVATLYYTNATTGKVYGVEFSLFDTSAVSTGTKTFDNAQLVCNPSTNTTAGRDDYANLALFAPVNINYDWSDTSNLEPKITEIEGVTPGFSLTNPNGLVGVLQMGAWVYVYHEGTKKIRLYSDIQKTGAYKPLPECVRAKDNSFRPWMIHAKYVAGKGSDGNLTSASGLMPASGVPSSRTNAAISHDGMIALWRKLGTIYSGGSMCDRVFMELMFEIKYAKLGSSGTIAGCNNYNFTVHPAKAEDNVTRVLLSETDGTKYLIGSTICVGTATDTSTDWNQATTHDIVDYYTIIDKTTITEGEAKYVALQLDVPKPFSTKTTYIVKTFPWRSGATDFVLGNDGSPYSNTSNQEPGKIQGIEFMTGLYEVLADTALYINGDGTISVKCNRKAASLATGGAGTGAYDLVDKVPMKSTASWNYIAEMGTTLESLMVPTQTGGTAGSSNGYQAACYTEASTTAAGWREWLASGDLYIGGNAGLPYVLCNNGLGNAYWCIGCRASGSGGNRGEFGAA